MCDLTSLPPTRLADLLACHTDAAIRHAVRRGVLDRPFRGVFTGRDFPRRTSTSVWAAQLSIGRELPAAFHSGADLFGFGVVSDGCVHLVGPEENDHSPQRGLRVHSTALPPTTSRFEGVLTTGPNRTAVDLARTYRHADVLAVLDAALRTDLVTTESLLREAGAHAGLRGIVGVRAMIDVADGRAESPQESRLRWIAVAAGLPPPSLQVEVVTRVGRYRLDMAYEELKVGIEYDGEGHAGRPAMRRDRTRHNALDEHGWRMLYFTDIDVDDHPQRTADRLAALHRVRAKPLPWRGRRHERPRPL